MRADRMPVRARVRGLPVVLAFCTLVAIPAAAVPVEVAFLGVVDTVTGTVPGNPGAATSFSGTLVYESDQTPVSTNVFPFSAAYDFSDNSASLSILLEGVTWGTDPASPAVTIVVTVDRFVDPDDPAVSEPPTNPDALPAGPVDVESASNVDTGVGNYEVALSYLRIQPRLLAEPSDFLKLPSLSEVVAQQILGGEIKLEGAGFSIVGTVTAAVPEPGTALLLGAGLVALGLRTKRR